MKPKLNEFNAAQREAIMHCDGPALILAGPGSGKTTVLTKHIEYLIKSYHVKPESILVVTFTKAAALEMQQRFLNLMEEKLPVTFGTFHAIFYHILCDTYQKHSPQIITENEKQEILVRLLKKYKLEAEMLSVCLEYISKVKNGCSNDVKEILLQNSVIPKKKSVELEKEETYQSIFREYQSICKQKGKIDFDDMAYEVLQIFRSNSAILKKWQDKFAYILVDEYQDISPIQEKILKLLATPKYNLFVVGDDDQSIYGFRGAGTELMLKFPERYPNTKEIRLEINYRCNASIIEISNKVIRENKSRFEKHQIAASQIKAEHDLNNEKGVLQEKESNLKKEEGVFLQGFDNRTSEDKEILRILNEIIKKEKNEKHKNTKNTKNIKNDENDENNENRKKLSNTAILFRKHADAEHIIGLLKKNKIPYISSKPFRSIWSHFVAKDILAYLRIIYREIDQQSFIQIMNRPERGIERSACTEKKIELQTLLMHHTYDNSICENIKKLQQDIKRSKQMKLYAAIMYIRKGFGYERFLQKEYSEKDNKDYQDILSELQSVSRNMEDLSELEAYISKQLTEAKASSSSKISGEGVQIQTFHGSKGLEYETVILPDLNEGIVPHKKAVTEKEIEEERRMLYVAMTRAKKNLYLFYLTGTKEAPEKESRFIKGLHEIIHLS